MTSAIRANGREVAFCVEFTAKKGRVSSICFPFRNISHADILERIWMGRLDSGEEVLLGVFFWGNIDGIFSHSSEAGAMPERNIKAILENKVPCW